jgi:ubiquinone/menaquinone biosynthesis C-methylase UbiE
LYVYNALLITSVICPGETVLDLACGPANQLAMVAGLNPESRFVGLDASLNMLEEGRATLRRCGIGNAELQSGDMTNLAQFGEASFDGVICTMSLHHLADGLALQKSLREARRVLRPGGGLYILDFGRLKRRATQRYFSQDWRSEQTPEFTQDYLHSLQAAFSIQELQEAARALGPGIACYATPLAPFIVIFCSPSRRIWSAESQERARALYRRLDAAQVRKFQAFARWLRMAGCQLPVSLEACGAERG